MNRHPIQPSRPHCLTPLSTGSMAAGLALVLGLLSGCSRSQPPTTPITELPAGSFAAQWRRDLPLPNTTLTALYLNDDKVFAYTADNRCLWISRASGQVLAFTQVTDPRDQLHGPLTLEDRVIFPCTKDLVVYDRDGKLLHKLHLKFAASSRAAGDGQRAFIGVDHTNSGRLTALDTQPQPYTLSPVWELMSFGQISAAPVVYEHQVFCGSRDARVYAVRADDRENLWPGLDKGYFQTGGEIVADLQADAEGVYVASMDGRLYCLSAATGRLRWTYHAGPPLRQFSSPVVTADSVYLYVPGQGVTAINKNEEPKPDKPARPAPASQPTTEPAARDELRAETQEIRKARWIVPAARQVLAADESHVYLAAADGQILAVDKQTGKIQFRSKRKDLKIFATNNSTDNLIFAATPKGQIYAIRPVHLPGAVGEWVMAN